MKRYLVLFLILLVPTSVFGLDVDTSAVNDALDIQYGGTDATTASVARANLGVAIGSDVQGYDANLPTWPSTVDATEVGHLNGVTSALQTQLDAKEGTLTNEAGLYSALSDVADFVQTGEIDSLAELESVSNGGAYMSDILAATGEANLKSIINLEIGVDVQAYDVNLPAWPSVVNATEVGYLNGVTSSIQNQIDAKEDTLTNSAGLAGAISDETGTGVLMLNVAPNIQGQVLWTGTLVDDDDCTGDQGKMWWDSTDTQFEFCNANTGVPVVVGSGGSATVEDVAYAIGWDGDLDGTSKNTLHDYLVNFDADYDGDFTDEAWFPSASGAPTDVPYYVTTADAGLSAEVVVPAFIQSIMDDTDEATFKATVNLEIGTDVQAYDANLITWPATIDATEVGYLNGLSGSLTTLLAAKEGTLSNEAGLYAALSDVTNFLQTGDTLDAADMTFDDTGAIITATNVEDALQENRTAIDLNTAKETNTDDQTIDVFSFNGTNLSISLEGDGEATKSISLTSVNTDDQTAAEVSISDAGALITATTVENALQENRTAIDLNTAKESNSSDATLLARANHTGTQTASTISDFDTEVANNSAVTANTAKETNTDNQNITGGSWNSSTNELTVGIEDGNSQTITIEEFTSPTLSDIELVLEALSDITIKGAAIAAGSFVTDQDYEILTVGTTDFTAIGASANTVGVIFTATGAGTGTGTAYPLKPLVSDTIAYGNADDNLIAPTMEQVGEGIATHAADQDAHYTEAQLEALLELQDLQGAVTDAQVPNDITVTGMTTEVASGTATLGTAQIADGACATAVTVSATGVATTDIIDPGYQGTPVGTTGYDPTAASLSIIPYPSANNVNFLVCNTTGAAITPGAMTINWRVDR